MSEGFSESRGFAIDVETLYQQALEIRQGKRPRPLPVGYMPGPREDSELCYKNADEREVAFPLLPGREIL